MLLQVLEQFSNRVDEAVKSKRLDLQFQNVKVWITRKVLDGQGLKYVLGRDDLLVVPYQTLAVYLPAIGDRLKVLKYRS